MNPTSDNAAPTLKRGRDNTSDELCTKRVKLSRTASFDSRVEKENIPPALLASYTPRRPNKLTRRVSGTGVPSQNKTPRHPSTVKRTVSSAFDGIDFTFDLSSSPVARSSSPVGSSSPIRGGASSPAHE
ncbi:hypothetical protein EXIGLDRAFT_836156 [Exidia glandulosa HHB12029]|uniref:Uncharacterized protein n=1 Tax=Exidia glandulosa HHB12029 TaxID=1314781 RepID=A0A166AKH8_EXIGL|nr:hypothetical protein EXIGLDRAFT_836156 [Exidia glandulosa HHB12029]